MRCVAVATALACSSLQVSAAEAITGRPIITDGDTIHVGPTVVRLYGIDAPEAAQSCNAVSGGTWPCGAEATRALQSLIGGEEVICQPVKLDRHYRTVARCFVGGLDIQAEMVRRGLARAFVKYASDYVTDEEFARASHLGIWQAPTQPPWDYRRMAQWPEYDKAAPPGCLIKGNVNHRGERIYHLPTWPDYPKVKMDLAKGKVWFCSEAEAVKAGWRPAF